MSGSVPIALPKDYGNLWGSEWNQEPTKSTVSKDPFRDSMAATRVTASGFTDSTVKNVIHESKKPGRQRNKSYNQVNQGADSSFEQRTMGNTELKSSEQSGQSIDPNKHYVTLADFKKFTEGVASSIGPDDSVSNTFQPLNIRRPSKLPMVEEESTICSDFANKTVIGGYALSSEQKMEELDRIVSVSPVRGLPIIFTNERLNFLVHIHDALFPILTDNAGKYPSEDCLSVLTGSRRRWGSGPAVELLIQVIDKTLAKDDSIVMANPFNLPVLEVSMKMTQKLMYMSLDLLHKEFEVEWFNTLKAVTTPKFQSKYDQIKFKRISDRRSSSDSSNHRRQSSSSSGHKSRRSSNGSDVSIISAFFGR